jgi:hypothetical protein
MYATILLIALLLLIVLNTDKITVKNILRKVFTILEIFTFNSLLYFLKLFLRGDYINLLFIYWISFETPSMLQSNYEIW